MSDRMKPPEESGVDIGTTEDPGFLGDVLKTRVRTGEEVSAAASPSEFGHIPGAEVLSGLGIKPGGFNKFRDGWKVLYAKIPRGSFRSLQELTDIVTSFGGEILKFPFTEEGSMELLTVFPNSRQASGAKTGFEAFGGARCGISGTDESYGGFIHGVPCFAGKGVDEAVGFSQGGQDESGPHGFEAIKDHYTDTPNPRILRELSEVPRNLSTVCAVAEIRMKNHLGHMSPDRRSALIEAVLGILNNRTDVFEWVGDKLRIVSTREQAMAILSVELKRVLKIFADADLQVVMAEGNLQIMNLGRGGRRPPRTLASNVLAGVRTANVPPKKGLFTGAEGLAQLQSPRGAMVKGFTRHTNGVVEIEDVTYRSSEVMTGGPQKMIGRDHLMSGVYSDVNSLTRAKKTCVRVLDGGPGIGKSRFIEETIKVLKEREVENVTYTKAYEHEATRGYSFVKKFVLELLKSNKDKWQTDEYKLLYFFVTGRGTPEALEHQVESLYMQPNRLAQVIRAVMVGAERIYAGFMDDLQWCDTRSAAVIAELIRCLSLNDGIMLEFSARSGTQEMPMAVRQALSERGVAATHLEALTFVDTKGAPTDILTEYVWESLKRVDPDVKPIFPHQFMTELGRVSGGVPFAVTQILLDLQRKGTLRINEEHEPEVVGEVNFADYTGVNLYENVIARLTANEQRIYEILVLFDGSLDMGLFRVLFPSLESSAHTLAKQEMATLGDTLKISHDLLFEAAKRKFPKDAVTTWAIYGQLQALAENPMYSKIITHQMRYGMVSPILRQIGGVANMQIRGSIYNAALDHGISAVQELETQHRAPEAQGILSEVLKEVGPRNMTPEQRYHCMWRLANVSFRMGDAKTLMESLQTCEKLLDRRPELDENGMRRLDVYLLQGDAAHMTFDPGAIETSIGKLALHAEGISRRSLQPAEATKVDAVRYVADLGRSRTAYHREEYQDAAQICKQVVTDIEMISRSMSVPLPFEHEKILVEARRFYGIIIGREEEVARQKTDADVMYMMRPDASRQAVLQEGIRALRKAVEDMRSPKPVMISPKHLAGALSMLARLTAFSGGSLGDAEKLIDETIREAANYREIGLLSMLHKLKGDLLMSRPERKTAQTIIEGAIAAYGKGRAEMMQLVSGRESILYAYNACNEARACAILAESFEIRASMGPSTRPGQAEFQVKQEHKSELIQSVQNGLHRAAEAIGPMTAQSKEEVYQYLFPTIGRLFKVIAKYDLAGDIQIPDAIMGIVEEDVDAARQYLSGAGEDVLMEGRSGADVLRDEADWKSSGLETLTTVVSGNGWARD